MWAGPELEQPHGAVADAQVELAVEGGGGRHRLDAVEGERAEDVAEEGAGVAEPVGRPHQPGEHGRRHLVHLAGAGRRRDDVGAGDELVAVAVVAVGVGVHDGADRRGGR